IHPEVRAGVLPVCGDPGLQEEPAKPGGHLYFPGVAGILVSENVAELVELPDDGEDLPHHAAAFPALLAEVGHAGVLFDPEEYAGLGIKEGFSLPRAVYSP